MKKIYQPYSNTNFNEVQIDYPQKGIDVRQYDPAGIFDIDEQPMTNAASQDLLYKFFGNRYRYTSKHKDAFHYMNARDFSNNMGATQFYRNGSPGGFYLAPSESYRKSGYPTHGHSERTQMRDLLNDHVVPGNKEVTPPKEHRGNNQNRYDQALEELKYLEDHTDLYQQYLNSIGGTVKMWSERGPCNRAGGNCSEFIYNILPRGSSYGFLTPYEYGDTKKVEAASKEFQQAYVKRREELRKGAELWREFTDPNKNPVVNSPNYSVPSMLDKSRYEFSPERKDIVAYYENEPLYFDSNYMGRGDPNKHNILDSKPIYDLNQSNAYNYTGIPTWDNQFQGTYPDNKKFAKGGAVQASPKFDIDAIRKFLDTISS